VTLILGGHPGANLRVVADVVLEPAVRVGDLHSELLVDQIHAPARRIGERSWAGQLDIASDCNG
jgi:hypothetical protein